MNIKAIIIEDELPARQTLRSYLKKYYPTITIFKEIDTVKEAVVVLKNETVDLLFLDVQLKDGLGIEILESISDCSFKVIFTTAHDNFTQEAFKHKAFGYLLKPIDPNDFKEIMNRVLKDITYSDPISKKIKVPTKSGFAMIDTSSIIRCEAESNYTKIFCDDNESFILSKTLKVIENDYLNQDIFIRVHQSHLVNINYVNLKTIENSRLKMQNGDFIPISRSRKEKLFQLLSQIKA